MVEISDNSELSKGQRFRNARGIALREFILQHDIYRPLGLCWEWKRYRAAKGYGVIIFDGFKFPVHRLSFEHYKGRIPDGFLVMHECDNPPCFNPNHLFLGAPLDNVQDMMRKGRHPSQTMRHEALPDLTGIRCESERASWAWVNPPEHYPDLTQQHYEERRKLAIWLEKNPKEMP